MGLADTALGTAWIDQASRALEQPLSISLPYRELARFDPARPEAVGYRFEAIRGQRIEISVEIRDGEQGRMFADLFRVGETSSPAMPQVASIAEELNQIAFEPRRTGEYVLRLQPELLRGGYFVVTIRSVPSVGFPVQGADMSDIGSFFGDSRDGGARQHEGVDIFAPRGTHVLAGVTGTVRSVRTLERGGLIVAVEADGSGLTLYYAHLNEQLVSRGQRVGPEDVIGTVGNTGNAITTPPHLHFGIYEPRWRAVDPWEFLYRYDTEPPEIAGDERLIGVPARATRVSVLQGTRLVAGDPSEPAGVSETLTVVRDETVIILGAAGDRYRVLLPDLGVTGYLGTVDVAPLSTSATGT